MKSIRMMLAVLASLAISAVSAQAIQYIDLNVINQLLNSNSSHSGEFNILDGGDIPTTPDFNPNTHQVTSASVWFTFADDEKNDAEETVSVDLGLVPGSVEVDSFSLLGGKLKGDFLVDLSNDGLLSYTINNLGGDFKIVSALLVAEVSPKTGNAVPDGGATAALLGLGLLGLSAVGRKMRS